MKLNVYQKICLAFFLILAVFWIGIYARGLTDGFYNYFYSFLFGIIPLIAGIIAIIRANVWGGFKSKVGKAVFFIGLGIFCWGVGEMVWSYYNFFVNIPAPYPSIADLGFAPSIFFYGLGIFYLSGATGAKFSLKKKGAKLIVFLASILILLISYYLLILVGRGGVLIPDGETPLKAVLDVIYPLGDFVGLLLGVIISGLSFKYLGGKYKYDIFSILIGVGVMFIADTIFSYTTTMGTYYNADFGDLMLSIGTFLISFGVLGFCKLKSD